MQIIVKRIIEKSKDRILIWFETKFGSGAAEWDGDAPKVGSKYFIEFGINDKFIWGENIRKSTENKPLIDYQSNNLIIQGKIDQIHDDGIIILSLTPSYSIMLDVGNTNLIKPGDFIEITANKVKLFNTNI
jgi:hypothetical protein